VSKDLPEEHITGKKTLKAGGKKQDLTLFVYLGSKVQEKRYKNNNQEAKNKT
jgi:hypothetical protein